MLKTFGSFKEQQKGRKFIDTSFRKQESDSEGFILENSVNYSIIGLPCIWFTNKSIVR